MNYILTVSYANEGVAKESYSRLVTTMKTDPCRVLLFDNHYPLNKKHFLPELCLQNHFEYFSHGKNVGLYKAWEYLLHKLPADAEKVIFYDGDHFPRQDDWHLALLGALDSPNVVHSTLMNKVIEREFTQRGYAFSQLNGINVKIAFQAMTNTVCAFRTSFLTETGGIIGGHKYYGGNEIAMWPHYQGKKWVFLEDFWVNELHDSHDWQYQEYKLLYAHRNLDMSFEDYLLSNPIKHGYDNLIKQIFG